MPKNIPRSLTGSLLSFLSSKWCFRLIVVFFVLEALWIALSGLYPMAFDEGHHLEVIRLYAHHVSPFWDSNPPGTAALGVVARDPSYLFHWLISFPYRLITAITPNLTTQVIFLRLINVGLFAAALPLYRRLLLKTGASRAIVHFCLALFVLIPVVPLLAAQINYDNLLLPLIAISLLWTVDFTEELRRGRLNIKKLLSLVIIVALTCLVKYVFLPIVLILAGYVIFQLLKTYRKADKVWPSRAASWLLVTLLIVTFGLFTERFAINLVRYHNPAPRCHQVLSIQQCMANGPWRRDHNYAQNKPSDATSSPVTFAADWFYGMWLRTFFAVAGPRANYQSSGPFIMPAVGAIVFSVAALAAFLASTRQVFRRYNHRVLWLFLATILIYTAALWLTQYRAFLHTGRAVALNGRYLLPILPLLMVILALAVNHYLKNRQLKLVLAVAAFLCMFWGGGALTYILRSNDDWNWPNSPLNGANHVIQDTIGPLVPGNTDDHAFMGRHGT